MVVNSIRQFPGWKMPNIIWQMVVASVILHIVVLFYMLHDVNTSYLEPVVSGQMNIVLKTTLETRKALPVKKPEKIIKQVKVKPHPQTVPRQLKKLKTVKKIEPIFKPVPIVDTKVESREIEEEIIEQHTDTTKSEIIDDASVTAQKSYVPPRSDASYLSNPKPFYPRAARRRGMQGMVVLEVEVNIDGLPEKVEIEMSSGFTLLDLAAVETVRRWRFVPAQRNGMAVVASVDVPVRFVLNEAN